MRQTWRPERTRSLPNHDIERGDIDLAVQVIGDLGRPGYLEEQRQRFLEIGVGPRDRVALAGDADLGTRGDVAVSLAFDDGSEATGDHAGALTAAERHGLVADDGERAVQRTIRSGLDAAYRS